MGSWLARVKLLDGISERTERAETCSAKKREGKGEKYKSGDGMPSVDFRLPSSLAASHSPSFHLSLNTRAARAPRDLATPVLSPSI